MLASGDPFHYGVGAVLARHVDARRDDRGAGAVGLQPGRGAARLVAAGDGAACRCTAARSICIRPHLQPGARILALTSDGDGPAALGAAAGQTRLRRLAADGARSAGRPRERIAQHDRRRRSISADVDALNMVAIEVEAAPDARVIAAQRRASPTICSSMTARSPSAKSARSRCRRWRRAAASCCGTSAPARARSRSNGCWPTRRMRAIAIEARADRAARIAATPPPSACRGSTSSRALRRRRSTGLPRPMRSSSAAAPARRACSMPPSRALPSGGRLVVNAVTLETEAVLIARHSGGRRRTDPHRRLARRAGRRQDGLAAGDAGDAMGWVKP